MQKYYKYKEKKDEDISKFGIFTGILGGIGTFKIVKDLVSTVVDTKNPIVKAGIAVAELTAGLIGFATTYKMSEPFEHAYEKTKKAYSKYKEENDSEEDEESEEDDS